MGFCKIFFTTLFLAIAFSKAYPTDSDDGVVFIRPNSLSSQRKPSYNKNNHQIIIKHSNTMNVVNDYSTEYLSSDENCNFQNSVKKIISDVSCDLKGVQLTIKPKNVYAGKIYVAKHESEQECRAKFQTTRNREYFFIKYGTCGLKNLTNPKSGETVSLNVIIKGTFESMPIVNVEQEVECSLQKTSELAKASYQVNPKPLTAKQFDIKVPSYSHDFLIIRKDSEDPSKVFPGDAMMALVLPKPMGAIKVRAKNCFWKTADANDAGKQVTDANGCATNPKTFAQWKWNEKQKRLEAPFLASDKYEHFTCEISYCNDNCPPLACPTADVGLGCPS